MTKIEIVGARHDFKEVLTEIHELGLLHIEDMSNKIDPSTYVQRMELDPERQKVKIDLESYLVKVNSYISALDSSAAEKAVTDDEEQMLWHLSETELCIAADELINEIEGSTRDLLSKKKELEIEQANLGKYTTMFSKLAPLVNQLVALDRFNTMMLLVDRKDANILSVIKEELSELTKDQFQIVTANIDSDTVGVIIIYKRDFSKEVQGFLWNQHVNEVRLPKEFADMPHRDAVAKMKERTERIPIELEEVDYKLRELSTKFGSKLAAYSQAISDHLTELQITDHFGVTDYTFVIQGWVPRKRVKRIKEELKQKFGSKVMIEELKLTPEEMESAPIMYSNPAGIRAFEPVLRMFGTPKYGSVDPTPFVAFFFPLFFGVILGDMGYALVILAISFWLTRRYKDNEMIKNVAVIFTFAGISSFIFGFFYGEFFGDLPHRLHLVHETQILGVHFPIDRQGDALIATLIFAVVLGVAQILIGLILGLVNTARAGHRKHFLEKAGLLLILVALVALALSYTVGPAEFLRTPGIVILCIAFPILIYGGGFMGVIEILGTVGNVLSYARIMALGLVSVVLASMANQAGASMGDNIILGIILAGLIHAVNIAIHVFTPSIHALRLNFVEFYGKFYEAGGTDYKPFDRGGKKWKKRS